jgi:hypothetical protein
VLVAVHLAEHRRPPLAAGAQEARTAAPVPGTGMLHPPQPGNHRLCARRPGGRRGRLIAPRSVRTATASSAT